MMKQFLLPIAFVFLISCNNSADKQAETKTDTNKTVAPATDTTPPATTPGTPNSKIDIESFGEIKIGQQATETIKALGNPDKKSKATEWGADGLMHEDWTWAGKGLVLNMSSDKNNVAGTLGIFSITANSLCPFKTRAGIGIGNSYKEVQDAYQRDINTEETTKDQIVVGSVYGGILFSFTNDKVSRIFLGPAAE